MSKTKSNWKIDNFKFSINSNVDEFKNNKPAHIHVKTRRGEIQFWLDEEKIAKSGEIKSIKGYVSEGEKNKIAGIVNQEKETFLKSWKEIKKHIEIKAGLREASDSDNSDDEITTNLTTNLNYQPQVEIQPAVQVQANAQTNLEPLLVAAGQGAVVGMAVVGVVVVGSSLVTSLATLNPLPLVAGLGFLARHYH